jgi:hypothetical protein
MKNNLFAAVFGLSSIIGLCAIGAYARNESDQRNTSSGSAPAMQKSYSHSTSSGSYSRGSGGVAKAAWSGSSSGSGVRGGGNHYYHNFYHGYNRGYHGWGSYWPYWSVGSYVTYLPDDYATVYVDGSAYYYSDGSYFAPYSNGYMVVPAPDLSNTAAPEAMVPAPSPAGEQTVSGQPSITSSGPITISIPNSKGGFTPVKLVKSKDGYIGPQGEYYAGHPTVAELRVLYGD